MWLAAFAFLATAAIILAATSLTIFGLVNHKPMLARLAAVFAIASIATYAAALIVTGMTSPDSTLAAGQEKHICEIDCHLAYAVTGVARPQPSQYRVTMRMRFDPETISSRRDNSQLYPGPRKIVLVDEQGGEYDPVQTDGLDHALRPGESTEAQLVFRIPADAIPVRMRFEDADPIKRLLIGSETALLHKRTMFTLGAVSG